MDLVDLDGALPSVSDIRKGIADFAKNTFGAGATTVHQVAPHPVQIIPDPHPITVETGTKTSTTTSSKGDSSKPISVYAQGRSDNYIKSSAGIKINISNFTLNISAGVDSTGISGSVRNGDKTNSFAIKIDFSKAKVGFEQATTVKVDASTNSTNYTNISASGWLIAAVYLYLKSGQWMPSPDPAYGCIY